MSKYESQDKYDKANTVQYKLKLNKKWDREIIDKLNSVGNRQGYIKDLIKADIHEEDAK